MTLATSNSQGELSPLEVGMHALHVATPYKNGGLQAYANAIGRKQQNVALYRDGARVAEKVHNIVNNSDLLTKAAHLAEISKLPESCWMLAAQKEAGLMAKGTRGQLAGPGVIGPVRAVGPIDMPTLTEIGITKNQSSRWQKLPQSRLQWLVDTNIRARRIIAAPSPGGTWRSNRSTS